MNSKPLLAIVCLTFLFLSCASETKTQQLNSTLHSNSKKVALLYEEQVYPYEIDGEDIGLPYNAKVTNIGFASENDTLKLKLKGGDKVSVNFIINKKDTVTTLIKLGIKPVAFTEAYQKKNKGKFVTANPEAHELVNIMVALSKIGQLDSNMVYMKTPYYKSVMNHFEPYSNHPIIDTLNANITEVFGQESYMYYYNLRMNANMYSFDDSDNIVNKGPYQNLGFNSESYLDKLVPLMNDFVKKSKFREFYKANKNYHDSLVKEYYRLVDLSKMWTWVESKFPERYDGYKVYFSPLVNGAHAAQKFNDNGYKESIMFVNAPIFNLNDERSESDRVASLARVVFTEIDHNYVNPVTDKYPEINKIMQPLECWNSSLQGYGSSYATFNEYMTWAVFTLYLKDNFDTETFIKRNKVEADFMQNKRGFIKFHAFNDFVLSWYKNHKESSLTELYPVVIDWIKKQNCKTQ